MRFKNRQILLGLTGSIAIYKSASLLRRLVNDGGAEVQVVMTKSAREFMTPLIFETFSSKPVLTEMFSSGLVSTRHVDLASKSDMVLVCPATANIVAKAANGVADDLLSTMILVAGNKTVFALAMNSDMYRNHIIQKNIRELKELGYGFIEPEVGDLACKTTGSGRLADERIILEYLDARLNGRNLLKGKKVVVTAGPTREPIDTVRFLSNRSSGKMGFALAAEAVKEGGDVTLITGPASLDSPTGVSLVTVETAQEMQDALNNIAESVDFLFMAAAVEDIHPKSFHKEKLKKTEPLKAIPVVFSPDVISSFRERNPSACVVGFSVESDDGKRRSIKKMKDKSMNFIVWNDPDKPGVGFESDTNEVTMISSDEQVWNFPLDSKRKIAEAIVHTAVENWH